MDDTHIERRRYQVRICVICSGLRRRLSWAYLGVCKLSSLRHIPLSPALPLPPPPPHCIVGCFNILPPSLYASDENPVHRYRSHMSSRVGADHTRGTGGTYNPAIKGEHYCYLGNRVYCGCAL